MAFRKRVNNNEKFILSKESSFRMKEDYRVLRTNIDFSFISDEAKVIAVTSSEKSEGKSTNAINIACAYAELDKRVLLIDCDCRLSTVAIKLGIDEGRETPGLTDVLVGKKQLSKVLKKYEPSNIYVLPAGTIPPDPTKLLKSEKLERLIELLRTRFDYIIIDCPPVTEVIDAVLIAPLVDGFVLVVKHESSNHRSVKEMIEQLQYANAKILGFIYVNAPIEDRKAYKKGKGKYYGGYYGGYSGEYK